MTEVPGRLHFEVIDYSSYQENGFPDNLSQVVNDEEECFWSTSKTHDPHFAILELSAFSIISKFNFMINESTLKTITMKEFRIFGMLENGSWNQIFNGTFSASDYSPNGGYFIDQAYKNTIFRYIKFEPFGKISSGDFLRVPPFFFEGICINNFAKCSILQEYAYETANIVGDHSLQGLRTPFTFDIHKNICQSMPKGICYSDKCFLEIMNSNDPQVIYNILFNIINDDKYEAYVDKLPIELKYTFIDETIAFKSKSSNLRPCPRGGHQMVYSREDHSLYLLGGWDGYSDLADFWKLDISTEKWFQISSNVSKEGGPSPRSCHQMCLSKKNRKIYVLGRYVDIFKPNKVENDFYVYDLKYGTWLLITEDTFRYAGPSLCFGHSMIYDDSSDSIYVFGGHAIMENSYGTKYGGFYTYHVDTDCWISSLVINSGPIKTTEIPSRCDHNLLICDVNRKLYITGGTRGSQNVSQIVEIDLETGINSVLYNSSFVSGAEEPNYLYTTRSFIMNNGKYIASYTGMERVAAKTKDKLTNSFFLFDTQKKTWCCTYKNKHLGRIYWDKHFKEPCPRYALQVTETGGKYDFHLFGGNPGPHGSTHIRLNDLWGGKFVKHTTHDHAKLLVRDILKERLSFLFSTDPLNAFIFLKKYSNYLLKEEIFDEDTLEEVTMEMFNQVDTDSINTEKNCKIATFSKNQHYYNLFKIMEPIIDFMSTPTERYSEITVSDC